MAHRAAYDCLEGWKLVIEQHPARLEMCYFLSLNSVNEMAAIDIVVYPRDNSRATSDDKTNVFWKLKFKYTQETNVCTGLNDRISRRLLSLIKTLDRKVSPLYVAGKSA